MNLKKKKPASKKAAPSKAKASSKKKTRVRRVLKAANNLRKTTKKMVDDVFLKLVGMRVLERAQAMSATIKAEKSQGEVKNEPQPKKTKSKKKVSKKA